MTIKIEIDLKDAKPDRQGCLIGYQAFPEDGATWEEINTSNVIIALCSLLSDPDFLDMIAPRIEKEMKIMRDEQDAALAGSPKVM